MFSFSNLSLSRNRLLDEAVKAGFDAYLWLDSDHSFPEDALLRLIAHEKPVVALNQPRRQAPITPTAVKGGELVQTGEGSKGLEQIDGEDKAGARRGRAGGRGEPGFLPLRTARRPR